MQHVQWFSTGHIFVVIIIMAIIWQWLCSLHSLFSISFSVWFEPFKHVLEMCVCGKHLNRCKTCTFMFFFFVRGVVGIIGVAWSHRLTKTLQVCYSLLWYAIWTQIARTCTRYSIWRSSEPARRFVFSTSFLHCWRNLNFNEDHIRILLMLILWTDEGDKFGLHFSLLAQLKTVVLELHVYLYISSWIRRWWPSTSGVSSSLSWQV